MLSTDNSSFWTARWDAGATPWDHGRPAPPFTEFLRRFPINRQNFLLPGCGAGHDVALFAQFGATATGIDIAPAAIAKARALYPHPNAHFAVADFLQPLPHHILPPNGFDAIAEHTCLCALHPALRPAYANAVRQNLRPNGLFLAIAYTRTQSPNGPPFATSNHDIFQLFSPHFELRLFYQPNRSYHSRQGRESIFLFRARH